MQFSYAISNAATDCSGATAIGAAVPQTTLPATLSWDTTGVPLGSYYICIDAYTGTDHLYTWSEGRVTIDDYCTGAQLTNALTANGSGTVGDPHVVCTLTQLDDVRDDASLHYRLGADIDASDTSALPWDDGVSGWLQIAALSGSFDGDGFAIRGLTMARSGVAGGDTAGLFASSTGSIANLTLENVAIAGRNQVGSLVGDQTSGTISNCHVSGSVSGSVGVGGLVGNAAGSVVDSSAAASVTSPTQYSANGGLAGAAYGTITRSWAAGNVSSSFNGEAYTGGLVGGCNDCTILGSFAAGTASGLGDSTYVGGLVGYANGAVYVRHSFAVGDVSGGALLGGLIGESSGTPWISASAAYGDVTGDAGTVGGFIGTNFGRIVESHAAGNVTNTSVGTDYGAGAFAARNYIGAVVASSYATGNIMATNITFVGGLAGLSEGWIIAAKAIGTVEGDTSVGGLVGSSEGYVRDSYATGDVTMNSQGGGGLAGTVEATGLVTTSYATGDVTGGSEAGGFVGTNNGAASYAFATGGVTGSADLGGVAGMNAATRTLTNVAWADHAGNPSVCVGQDNNAGATSCTAQPDVTQFYSSSNAPLSSWDFAGGTWKLPLLVTGLPRLGWESGY